MNILTPQEATDILKYNSISELPGIVTSILMPAIDDYIKTATGKDWTTDPVIDPTAKMVACVLLVRWSENPGALGEKLQSNDFLVGSMTQLHAKVISEAVV